MRKLSFALLTLVLVLLVLLVTCAPKATPTPTPKPKPTEPRATERPPTPIPPTELPGVTITMWEQEEETERNTVLYPLVSEFMEANPHITVEVANYGNEELRTQFETASLTGQAPEIIRCPNHFAGPFSTMDILLPIKDMFDGTFLETFLPGALAGGVVAGTLWGIPDQSGSHLMLLYNKEYISTPPADSDEMIKVAQEVTDEAAGIWGLAYNTQEPFWLAPWLGGFGGWVLDDATDMPTLNTPAMVAALQFLQDLSLKYRIVPLSCDYETADTLFKEGKAAMLINADWSLGAYLQEPALEFGTAPIPMIKETGLWPTPMTISRYYMISEQVQPGTPKFNAVKKFVEFMTGEHAQEMWLERFKQLPSNKNVAKSPLIQQDPILRGSAAQLEKSRGLPAAPQLRCFWDSARPVQRDVLAGTITPAEAAQKMQEDAERWIEESQP